jgi:hypothetical protein
VQACQRIDALQASNLLNADPWLTLRLFWAIFSSLMPGAAALHAANGHLSDQLHDLAGALEQELEVAKPAAEPGCIGSGDQCPALWKAAAGTHT